MMKNFNDVYESIYKNGNKELKTLTIQTDVLLLSIMNVFTLAIILTIYFRYYYFLIIGGVIILLIFLNYVKKSKMHRYKFKNIVMKPIVQLCSSQLLFLYDLGVNLEEYKISEFDKFVNKVYSEDLIEGQATDRVNLKMSQIRAVNYKDTQQGRSEVILFNGVYGYCNLNGHFVSLAKVETDKKSSEFSMNRLEMDSMKFEGEYDIFAENKIQAMQIFNSEVIELMNKFKQETGYMIELRIFMDKIFFRIPCEEIFEAPLNKNILDYSLLYEYYKIIQLSIDIIDKIVENIEQL